MGGKEIVTFWEAAEERELKDSVLEIRTLLKAPVLGMGPHLCSQLGLVSQGQNLCGLAFSNLPLE